jgi:hypothetical protein
MFKYIHEFYVDNRSDFTTKDWAEILLDRYVFKVTLLITEKAAI